MLFIINPAFPPRLAKTVCYILLCLTPDDFTYEGRASGWELHVRVKYGFPPKFLCPCAYGYCHCTHRKTVIDIFYTRLSNTRIFYVHFSKYLFLYNNSIDWQGESVYYIQIYTFHLTRFCYWNTSYSVFSRWFQTWTCQLDQIWCLIVVRNNKELKGPDLLYMLD